MTKQYTVFYVIKLIHWAWTQEEVFYLLMSIITQRMVKLTIK